MFLKSSSGIQSERKYYQGLFKPTHPEKYEGDVSRIIYRSSWERGVLKWADLNPDIKSWSSEEVIVHYIDETDHTPHRYFVDFKFTFKNGQVLLVEVKPQNQIDMPKRRSRNTRKFLQEMMVWGKNQSKWKYAQAYAKKRGWVFQVWSENVLKGLGIPIYAPSRRSK